MIIAIEAVKKQAQSDAEKGETAANPYPAWSEAALLWEEEFKSLTETTAAV